MSQSCPCFSLKLKSPQEREIFTFKILLRRQTLYCSGMLPNWCQSFKEQGGGKMHFFGSRVSVCSARKQISLEGTILLLYSSSNYLYKLEGRAITQQTSLNKSIP